MTTTARRTYPRKPIPTSPGSRALRVLSWSAWASLAWDVTLDLGRWPLWLAAALLAYLGAFLIEVRLREDQVDPVDAATLALEEYAHDLRHGLAEDPLTREGAQARAKDALRYLEQDRHR